MSSVIPLSAPDITEAEIDAVTAALRSGRLSMGPRMARFEQLVADRAGRGHGVATSSGTGGLHLALTALGVGPGDEVITTPYSFIASANVILYCGATPVFVDIEPRSCGLSADAIEKAITSRTRAIIAVDVFGRAGEVERIEQIAQRHELPLIEDACEGLGGWAGDRPLGSFGRLSVFAFYPNKQITTGEGGMIVTDDDQLAETCRCLRNQGRQTDRARGQAGQDHGPGSWLEHDHLGFNYRLNELSCALGVAQMERLDEILERRRKVAQRYMEQMIGWEDVQVPNIEDPARMSWFAFVVRLTNRYDRASRDRIIQGMHRHDIGAGNFFPCIHLQTPYQERFGHEKGDFPVAESIADRSIALPMYGAMDATHVELVTHTLKVMIQREQLLERE
ncbi:MAG: DegT/DnrJ/EryC1/StrS family aminotransferase [Phycisphaeraceae bacterium]|nr:DegT/DnrJ/EryC1/StrS family aminotransferase [Phycisphaeraceae bacterium]